jgi:secreted trypsin-like serine protease
MICAGLGDGKDTCEGDSGSAIVYKNPSITSRWIGVGLTSFGGNGCGGSGVLGTYTNVSCYCMMDI